MPNSPASLDRKFNGLIAKIEEGECVLVLGPRITAPPEVAGADNVPIDQYTSARLMEDLGGEAPATPLSLRQAIARYQRENNASTTRSLMQGLAADFDGQTTELHLNLAALPFRLILSATPDRMMAAALRAKGKPGLREALYDYCGRSNGGEALRGLPTASEPIVYSLFGRHDRPESMVLDDTNLLDYLVTITREKPALPDPVRATLRAPSTVFLFIGFGFTNWWLRLLLKVLEVTGVENRGVSLALEDESTFKAATASEQPDFFKSLGIYIETRDWNALARELAARARPALVPAKTGATTSMSRSEAPAAGRPLVFLSYASEDVDRVEVLRDSLQGHGITVWHDKQNLRAGQNWDDQIARVIQGADFFLFVQTDRMDERDRQRQNGVYNGELKRAIERQKYLPYATVYLLHVTLGTCRQRNEPELGQVHRIAVDSDEGLEQLSQAILEAYSATAVAG